MKGLQQPCRSCGANKSARDTNSTLSSLRASDRSCIKIHLLPGRPREDIAVSYVAEPAAEAERSHLGR